MLIHVFFLQWPSPVSLFTVLQLLKHKVYCCECLQITNWNFYSFMTVKHLQVYDYEMFTSYQIECLQFYDCEEFTTLRLWNVYNLPNEMFTVLSLWSIYKFTTVNVYELVWCIYACVTVGHFIYFDGNGANYVNYTATPVARTENHCLSFWYFMSGYVGSLTLYVTDSSRKRSAVWYRNDDHGSTWLQAEVDIPAGAFPLQEVKGLWRYQNVYRLQYLTTTLTVVVRMVVVFVLGYFNFVYSVL